MLITVALNGSKRRDLRLFNGDQGTIVVQVYAADGDEDLIDPSLVTDLSIATLGFFNGTIPVGTEFAVPAGLRGRNWYTLYGTVNGLRTTLACGWLIGYDATDDGPFPRGNDYGFRWPYGGWSQLP